MNFTFHPGNAPIPQWDRLGESSFGDVLIDGGPAQAGAVDNFFQANDSHERAPLVSFRGFAKPVKKYFEAPGHLASHRSQPEFLSASFYPDTTNTMDEDSLKSSRTFIAVQTAYKQPWTYGVLSFMGLVQGSLKPVRARMRRLRL